MKDVRKWLKKELANDYYKALPKVTVEQIAKGKKVYQKYCIMCHGASGKGDGPASKGFTSKPADFTDAHHSHFYTDRGRLHIIQKGIAGTPMSGWEKALSKDDIDAVYGYVRSLRSDFKLQN